MAKILAIETSSKACSVALCLEGKDYSFHEIMPKQHTERLLGVIEEIMIKQELTYQGLDAISVGCGPGSFTGTRLACSVVQGLSYSSKVPAIKVSSMEVMAEHFKQNYHAKEVVTILNAHMGQLYIGHFLYNDELISYSETGIKIEDFDISSFGLDTFFIGDGCDLVKDKLNKHTHKVYECYPNAIDLLAISKKKFEKKEVVSPENILPVYLTGQEHWI